MPLRKILLRLMLIAVGLSAVAGVAAVLLARGDTIGRVIGTGVEATVASALLMLLTLMVDKERARAAGLLGMCGVTLAFILSILVTWDFGIASRSSWFLPLTLLLTAGMTPPMMICLYVTRFDRGRYAGFAGLGFCTISSALFLLGIWADAFGSGSWSRDWQLAASGWIVLGLGLIGSISIAGMELQKRWWNVTGAAFAMAGLVWALAGIWNSQEVKHEAIFTAIVCLAVIFSHANLTMLCTLSGYQRYLRIGSIAAVILTASLVEAMAIQKVLEDSDSLAARGAGASAVAAACGTLAVIIVAMLNRKTVRRTVPENVKQVTLTCPWCGRKDTLPLGKSACVGCGLQFEIQVTEPRCPNCDYLLYMMTSDKCPECGTPINRPSVPPEPSAITPQPV